MLKKKDKNKVNKSKNTIVGGVVKDENISIMPIKDKLELLRKISNLSIIKDSFKNSPFDKKATKKDSYILDEFIANAIVSYDSALKIIKYILMCLYLGEDECYYYLEKYIRSQGTYISNTDYPKNSTIFPNIEEYKIDDVNDVNYTTYNDNVNLLFEDLKSKIGKTLSSSGETDMVNNFIINKYKYKLYLKKNVDNEDTPLKANNVDLYVPIEYYDSVTDEKKKKLMEGYKDNVTNVTNLSFKKVLSANINIIIKDINTNKADNEDIIVIKQNYKKALLNEENLTGTMIIGFINSLYDTPSIYTLYEEHINQNKSKYIKF